MAQLSQAWERYEKLKASATPLDITRGKPAADQLDLSNELLGAIDAAEAKKGGDYRNYGGLEGTPEARALFAEILEVKPEQVVIGGNSSLQLMYESLSFALLHGVPGGSGPWVTQKPKFVCPVPGYDRHFAICENLGIQMINVASNDEGPDMDEVEKLVASDSSIKGMWLVPKYCNPTGVTVSAAVVQRLARMKTAAPDFRIMWDNAYVVHDLVEGGDTLENGDAACAAAGNPDRLFMFASTSKITFAGAGLSAFASSKANVDWFLKHHGFTTIGPDKLNQLRHVRFLKNLAGVKAHMKKHAALIVPKFEVVQRVLETELGGTGLATWTRPKGGYFVSLETKEGMASKVVSLAAAAGVKLTPAGSAFPYKKDPKDTNIRISPTFATLADLERAMEIVAVCVQCAAQPR
jgi:DNA-binding transcriptional MocR family regulator